jgi:hypothetical protein
LCETNLLVLRPLSDVDREIEDDVARFADVVEDEAIGSEVIAIEAITSAGLLKFMAFLLNLSEFVRS